MSRSRKATDARLMNGLLRALECSTAGLIGAMALSTVTDSAVEEIGETTAIAAVGGLVTGLLEKPERLEYQSLIEHRNDYGLRPIVRYGLHTLGINTAREQMTSIVMNMISVSVGFLLANGFDAFARRYFGTPHTQMTLGNLFKNTAVGSIPVSMTISLVLSVMDTIATINHRLFGRDNMTYFEDRTQYKR